MRALRTISCFLIVLRHGLFRCATVDSDRFATRFSRALVPSQPLRMGRTSPELAATSSSKVAILDEGDDVMNITVAWDTLAAVNSTDSFVMSGPDAIPNAGDALAFFDQSLGYLGSATVHSISPPNLPLWGGQPITVQLNSPSVG